MTKKVIFTISLFLLSSSIALANESSLKQSRFSDVTDPLIIDFIESSQTTYRFCQCKCSFPEDGSGRKESLIKKYRGSDITSSQKACNDLDGTFDASDNCTLSECFRTNK